jgi:hypothetical protein
VTRPARRLKIAPHNVPVTTTGTRDYRLARALRARLLGALLAALGVVVLVLTAALAVAGVSGGVVVAVAAVVVLGAALAAVLLGRGWYVVRLDDTGYRIRFVRGVGQPHARWTDVADLTTAVVSGTPCVVLRLRNGSSSTVPVELIEGDREAFVDELQRRLDAGHGYRRL